MSDRSYENDDDSDNDAYLTSEIREIIAATQYNFSSDEDEILSNQNTSSDQNIQSEQTSRKSTNPIISSPDYIAAMTHVKRKREAAEIEKKARRAVRLEKARSKLEKMQDSVNKLQKQVSDDKK